MTENGKKQVKELSKAQLKDKLAKYEQIVGEAVMFIPKDNLTFTYHDEGSGVTFTLTDDYAVVMSATSRKVFPNNHTKQATVYNYLVHYVSIMNNPDAVLDDFDNGVIERVNRFLYILFRTDTFFQSDIDPVLDFEYFVVKDNAILGAEGKGVYRDTLSIEVAKSLLYFVIKPKEGVEMSNQEQKELLEKPFNSFIEGIASYLEENGCEFNHRELIAPIDENEEGMLVSEI